MTAALYAMLAAAVLWLADCISPGASSDRRDTDPALTKWAADQDQYWEQLSARDDARNAEREQHAVERTGILAAVDRYRASHHESPRTTGDVRQDWREVREGHDIRVVSQEVEDDFKRRFWEATKRRWHGDSFEAIDDADKEVEEAARYGR